MDEKALTHDDVAEQAVHDRSVIDHVLYAFSSGAEAGLMRAPNAVHSAAIYHCIRRTWVDQR